MAASTRKNTRHSSKPKMHRKRVDTSDAAEPAVKKAQPPEVRIFVSYSHKDAAAQEKLQTHLAPWKRDGVTVFVDKSMEPGAQLDPEIARELRSAHIFVALFSPSTATTAGTSSRSGSRARKLVRVIVKPCGWKQTRAAGFKLLPDDGRA